MTSTTMTDTMTRLTWDQAEASLREAFGENYEPRPPQAKLARLIEQNFATGGHLLADAGTGVGKSMANLIPAIGFALANKTRVVVSTGTKALQDQYAEKDLPTLHKVLPVQFRSAILKGRRNYGCSNRARMNTADITDQRLFDRVTSRDYQTGEATRESLGFDVEHDQWSLVCSDAEDCRALECARYECGAKSARKRAEEAHIVVVNHALLAVDSMLHAATAGDISLLGNYRALVVDECHTLERWIRDALTETITLRSVKQLTSEVATWAQRYGATTEPLIEAYLELQGASETLWAILPGLLDKDSQDYNPSGRLKNTFVSRPTNMDAIGSFRDAATKLYHTLLETEFEDEDDPESRAVRQHSRMLSRAGKIAERMLKVLREDVAVWNKWVSEETTKSGATYLSLNVGPVMVDDWLADNLWSRCSIVAMSATVAVRDDKNPFGLFRRTCGVPDTADEVMIDSPFDYQRQSALFIPNLPEPAGKTRRDWEVQSLETTVDVVRAVNGNALLLYTAISDMRRAYDRLVGSVDHPVIMQGQAPIPVLVEKFKEHPDTVLLGTKSFFEGVSIDGLNLVVISKAPFEVPTEPQFEAVCEALEKAERKRLGTAYNQYRDGPFPKVSLPNMILAMRQGHGRAIRDTKNRAIVVVLDPRMGPNSRKGWGMKARRSLPDCPILTSLEEVQQFMEAM